MPHIDAHPSLDIRISADAIRVGPRFAVRFHRTLRIPDDGRAYPLPPGLGTFPIVPVADHAARVPRRWRDAGGVFLPMYQREALWLSFAGADWKPNAVQVSIGGVNAVSGETGDDGLRDDPQNYIVTPEQPWLDGINTGSGTVRQFVALPLGHGLTVAEAIRGGAAEEGMRITVFEPKPGRFPDAAPPATAPGGPLRAGMGFGAGGRMRQKLYPDRHGLDTWDPTQRARVAVHIVNSEQFRAITGTAPPAPPIDAATYSAHGLPWFDLYDEQAATLAAPQVFSGVSISEQERRQGRRVPSDASIDLPDEQIQVLDRSPDADPRGVPTSATQRRPRGARTTKED
jgi:hypothetical protein